MPDNEKKQTIKKEEKNKVVEKDTSTTDFEVWFPKPEFIETIHKERIKIPVLNAGKEARIFQSLARLLEKLPKEQIKGDLEEFNAADLFKILPDLLKDAPKEAFSIVSELLTSKERSIDEQWVEDNLNFEKIIDLILPFVAGEAKLFEKVGGLLEKLSLTVSF